MNVTIEKTDPHAQIPRKANPSDACFDLYCSREIEIPAQANAAIETGIAIQMEDGWEAQIRGRSGLASQGIVVHPGTIDHLYRKPIKVLIHNLSGETFTARVGDRIAQMKISKVWDIQLLEGVVVPSERGGLGSTGR